MQAANSTPRSTVRRAACMGLASRSPMRSPSGSKWRSCAPELLHGIEDVPAEATFHFVKGLEDYLKATIGSQTLVHPDIFSGKSEKPGGHGTVEWAIGFVADADGFLSSNCNTIPTAD